MTFFFFFFFLSRKLYCSGLLKNKQTQKLTLHWIFAIRTGCLLVCVWVEWWLTALTVAHCAAPALKADRAVALALEDVRSWCVGVCVSAPIETLGWQSPWQGQQGRRALSVASLDLWGQLSTHTRTHTQSYLFNTVRPPMEHQQWYWVVKVHIQDQSNMSF